MTLLIIAKSHYFAPLDVTVQDEKSCVGSGQISVKNKTFQLSYNVTSLYDPQGTGKPDSNLLPKHYYQFSVCGDLANPTCPGKWCFEEVAVANHANCVGGIAQWNSDYNNTITYFGVFNDTLPNNLNVYNTTALLISVTTLGQSRNLSNLCPDQDAMVNYNYLCSSTTVYSGIHENHSECVFNVSYLSPLGCVTVTVVSSSDDDELSGGTIFLIVVILLALAYLILGCAYNSFYHGRVGMDAFPNKDSWTLCCRYVKAGCEATRDCVCFCCPSTSKGGEFQTLSK